MKTLILILVVIFLGTVGYFLSVDTEEKEKGDMTAQEEVIEEETAEMESVEVREVDVEIAPTSEFTIDSFNFGYSETELLVKKGDTVTINLTNSGGFHDLVIDEFSVVTEKIKEGETTSVTFVAAESGTFEYYCSVGSHRLQGMVGTLIVE